MTTVAARRRLEAPEAAPVVDEGPAPVDARAPHPAHDELVVTGVMHQLEIAFHPRQGAVEQRSPVGCRSPAHPDEFVATRDGEVPAERLLVLGQDVHAERPGGSDAGPARGALPRSQGHQRWVE